MFDLVFLGTSAAAPSIHRGLSSVAVLAGEDRFLVDCGEGTQRQILRSGIGFKRLNKIFLTHAHLDHILGIGGLVSTYTRWEGIGDIHIWGGASTLERIHTLIYDVVLRDQTSPIPIYLHEVAAGVVYEGKHFNVRAVPVTHRGRGCFGYVFQEHTRRPFIAEQAEALGVPPSAERAALVRGETVTLADGRVITPDMVLGAAIPGTKLFITGDVGRTDNLREAAREADALVIEATFLEAERGQADAFGHITARQAAELAADVGVRGLILTHLSRRYSERMVLHEAQVSFPAAYVARDLDAFRVRRAALERVQADAAPPSDAIEAEDEALGPL